VIFWGVPLAAVSGPLVVGRHSSPAEKHKQRPFLIGHAVNRPHVSWIVSSPGRPILLRRK
jgi:hypothetical protein